ncbi:uncharacterized protein N0V89_008641 [Didymosphaeria variabile]|uniref:Rhodopsin domain-containing protein n=1 Tax=Didymosphaeria variabile TaxID=1932322 RepID=A0A9W8XGN5_9PLEO|nr:uncharacterized protein N0V89_008641 [Didymosphaeria variabile]KAJ4350020.1 hypothetical protein N0V89_008641 [Didymosphaeria variabile]
MDGTNSCEFPPGFLEESRVPQIVAGNAAVQTLGCLVFFARVYSRAFLIGTWKSEDWALSAAWLLATGYSICQYGQVSHGSGRHLAATPSMKDAMTGQKYAYAAQIFLILGIPMPKVSMCLSYLRIFYSDIVGRRLIYGLLVTLALTMISFLMEAFFTCSPLSLYWNELRPTDKCLKDISTLYIHGSLNLAIDVALMGILIPRILNLKLNKRQKGVLIVIVLLGSLSVAAGIVRLVRVGTTLAKANSATKQFDPPWDMYDVSIWTSTEIYVALICAAAPGIKPLVSMLLPKLLGTSLRSRSKTTGGSHAYELHCKMKRSTLGTTTLTSAHGPYSKMSKVYSAAKHDEESLDGKSDVDERCNRVRADGIMRNTSVVITSEQRA